MLLTSPDPQSYQLVYIFFLNQPQVCLNCGSDSEGFIFFPFSFFIFYFLFLNWVGETRQTPQPGGKTASLISLWQNEMQYLICIDFKNKQMWMLFMWMSCNKMKLLRRNRLDFFFFS